MPASEPVVDHRKHGTCDGCGLSGGSRCSTSEGLFWIRGQGAQGVSGSGGVRLNGLEAQRYFLRIGPRALRVAAGHSDFSVMMALRRASWQGQFGSEGRVGMTRDKMALA